MKTKQILILLTLVIVLSGCARRNTLCGSPKFKPVKSKVHKCYF